MVDPDTDTDAGILSRWQHCHRDTVAAVDINAEKQQVSFTPNSGFSTVVWVLTRHDTCASIDVDK
jgi:hypothetical protein